MCAVRSCTSNASKSTDPAEPRVNLEVTALRWRRLVCWYHHRQDRRAAIILLRDIIREDTLAEAAWNFAVPSAAEPQAFVL